MAQPPSTPAVPSRSTVSGCRQAYCLTCQRDVSLSPLDELFCPVCSSALIPATIPNIEFPRNASDIRRADESQD